MAYKRYNKYKRYKRYNRKEKNDEDIKGLVGGFFDEMERANGRHKKRYS